MHDVEPELTKRRQSRLIDLELRRGGVDYVVDEIAAAVVVVANEGGAGRRAFDNADEFGRNAVLNEPSDVALDAAGNLYICDMGNNRIRRVDRKGTITTIAGSGPERTG